MKIFGLFFLVASLNAHSLEQRYPASLLKKSQESICHPEDSQRALQLTAGMHAYVLEKFEREAQAQGKSLENYLNQKSTHDAFMAELTALSRQEKLEAMDQPEFMLLSLEVGLRFQILATVRFPTLSMIDQASEVLQNQWLPLVEEVSNNPKGCTSAPQVNSSERGSSVDKSAPSESSVQSAPAAVGR